jgi:hypothetical protein
MRRGGSGKAARGITRGSQSKKENRAALVHWDNSAFTGGGGQGYSVINYHHQFPDAVAVSVSNAMSVRDSLPCRLRAGSIDDGGPQPCSFAQQLAWFVDGGRSIAGFRSKKPLGISLNPVMTHGWTGKSSVRTV